MQDLFNTIAGNPTLQALSIIVTLGSFFIFISKLIIPIFRFCYNVTSIGYRRAYVKAIRKILKRVRIDSKDQRLIISTLAYYMTFSAIGVLLPILMNIGLESFIRISSFVGLDNAEPVRYSLNEKVLMLTFAIPMGSALGWLSLYPLWRLLQYCHLMRRHIRRSLVAISSP